VGLLNYLNTMIYSIQNRITTFAIMEGIGMTRKQVIKLLIKEGLIYALSSILMTISIGTIVTYFIFQAVNYMGASFTIPVLPLLLSFSLIILICIMVSIILYYHIVNRNSLIERLRDVK
ncbi:FtsX-like permease family protein, partial [Thomasclavelia sp.]|uniref:FtsX-like permease family protein n=1 Tax=Thomasclavelia sp. TaxID=3025757 RepID=UPI0025F0908A